MGASVYGAMALIALPGASLFLVIPTSSDANRGTVQCGGTYTACEDAQTLNVCYEASDSSGGSNAMSSSPVCGTV